MNENYELLDSGNGKKLERFGPYTIVRPAAQAICKPLLPKQIWESADAIFTREDQFHWERNFKGEWLVDILGMKFRLSMTDFGHLGVFPEQKDLWEWSALKIKNEQKNRNQPLKILNLFAYSGGATLMAAREGAEVCHLDASKGMVAWARENAALNALDSKPIRWIIDDVKKFLLREIRRNSFYDGIILDPPTFGKGSQGQVFKFEQDLYFILELCRDLLSHQPAFLVLSCHTPNITPLGLHYILAQVMQNKGGTTEHGEMLLKGSENVLPLPNGIYARWYNE